MNLLFRDTPLSLDKELKASLLSIYGVGYRKASVAIARSGLPFLIFFSNVNIYSYNLINYVLKILVRNDARIKRKITVNINKLIDSESYRGVRHKLNLSVRGQRTRTNAATQRSKRIKNRENI